MLMFRMEPAVIDVMQLAGLFQPGVLVVDEVYQFFVIANDSQLTGRDVYLVKGYAVEA